MVSNPVGGASRCYANPPRLRSTSFSALGGSLCSRDSRIRFRSTDIYCGYVVVYVVRQIRKLGKCTRS